MRIDLISIFPAYFDALDLSLPGKARSSGLLEVVVHDLRDWTHDRHRSVDDTPYGGGAGMVMKPGPWGEALDAMPVGVAGATLVVPTPAGRPFTQALARELAGRQHLVFACGRYEGIDQRVVEEAGSATTSGSSPSATTCSTVARWPRSPSARRWSGCSRVSWATRSRSSRSRTRTGCSRRRCTPSRPPGAAARCPPCCSAATTARSPAGGTSSRYDARRSAGPTCSRRRC